MCGACCANRIEWMCRTTVSCCPWTMVTGPVVAGKCASLGSPYLQCLDVNYSANR
jgi:hypothetical protein